ncbi:unnamed protein product [Gongylonema pulchrum]|uniref:Kelch-like protein 10 n=1 Tax=Gongylonema pulchrum TaxID=637853 RepID=A0A183E615_9BILA|nr:unnamed protein product [Gongylonema pulchrum]
MYDQRCYVACAQLDEERIIAFGGYNNYDRLRTAEIFHIPTNQWHRRSGVGAANMERVIIVCGGFDGTSRLQSCEFLDEREGKWHVLKSMNRPRSNFGIEVLGNEVVVAGGYGGIVGTIDDTEAYDFRANAWKELPKMGLRRSAVYLTKIEYHDIIEAFVRPKPLNY